MINKIVTDLFSMRDEKFAKFNASLLPTINKKNIIGVRTPELKKYAKTISNNENFLNELDSIYLFNVKRDLLKNIFSCYILNFHNLN